MKGGTIMHKLKKSLSLLLLFCILVSCFPITVFAGKPEQVLPTNSVNVSSPVEQTSDLNEYPTISEAERVIKTFHNDNAEVCFRNTLNSAEKLEIIENLFECTLNIEDAHQILDTTTESEYTRFICEDRTEVSFSEDGDLFRISTIYGELATSQINVMSIEEMQDICLDLMPDLYQLFNIKNEYILTDTYDFDEDYLFFTFEKMLENGITNPFQSINVVFNKDSLNFSIAAKFDSAPNAIDPQISESEAIAVANEHAVNENLFNSAKLTYISDRLYNLKIDHYNDNICYLVYEVSSSNNDGIFYIDALSGEYVGRDLIMGETGFAVAI